MASRRSSLVPLKRTLRRTFGLEKLRPGQADVISSVLDGRDTVAIMPTGAGKSLCYQLPALHLEGTTIIVSPLISLMKDQVDKLREAGLNAVQLNSAISAGERAESGAALERHEAIDDDVVAVRFGDDITRRFRAEFVRHSPASEQGAA